MRRVPEVIDVWFDSGAMPFAQWHAPFENEDVFERNFPADFICEALDQTRGWFYSLLAVSTLLFDRAPYRNVVCLGLILDEQGEKMSKSKGNIVVPWDVLDAHGADAFRWYFFTSKHPWDGYLFSVDAVGESLRSFLLQLWNTYSFYVLYANASRDATTAARRRPRWTAGCSRACAHTVATVTRAPRRLRRHDRRPRASPPSSTTSPTGTSASTAAASGTATPPRSRRCTTAWSTVAKLLAPFCPFVADEIYDNLDGSRAQRPPVRLARTSGARRPRASRRRWSVVREAVELGRSARSHAKVKLRQPLRAAVIVASGARARGAGEPTARSCARSSTSRSCASSPRAPNLGSYEIKPNYRALGPRFGKQMPQLAAAVAALDAGDVADGAARRAAPSASTSRAPSTSSGRTTSSS